MVPYDASDHFEQIFLLYFDARGRSLLIGDRLENCWLATGSSYNMQIYQIFMKIHINNNFIDPNHNKCSNCSPSALTHALILFIKLLLLC